MSRFSLPITMFTERFNIGRFTPVRMVANSQQEGGTQMPLANRLSNLRPISEFLDFKRLSKPQNFAEVQSRATYNMSYFASNYAVVFVMLSIYSLLTNLLLLFVIGLVVGGMWGIGKLAGRDLEVGPIRATPSQLYTTLLCVAVPLGIIASPISTVLWLIGASGVTIVGHASFMDKPIENAFSGEAV
ncbi:Prenylated Rab acceptor 1 [Rhizina undulata]